MFKIQLHTGYQRYTGVEALDLRRRLGLDDGATLEANFLEAETGVSEKFARTYFEVHQYHDSVHVSLKQLRRGDVAIANGVLCLTIPAHRIIELYLELRQKQDHTRFRVYLLWFLGLVAILSGTIHIIVSMLS